VEGIDAFTQGRVDSAYNPLNSAAGKKAMASIKGGWRYVNFDSSPAAQKKAQAVLPSSRIKLYKPAKELEGIVADPTAMLIVDFYVLAGAHVPDDAVYSSLRPCMKTNRLLPVPWALFSINSTRRKCICPTLSPTTRVP